jgi:hypothetical protein
VQTPESSEGSPPPSEATHVLVFTAANADKPRARQAELRRAALQVRARLSTLRLAPSADLAEETLAIVHEYAAATDRYADFVDRRNRLLERALTRALDALEPGDLRADVVAVLCGTKHIGRDPRLLTKHQYAMFEQYQRMPQKRRDAMRTLFALAANAPEGCEDENGG